MYPYLRLARVLITSRNKPKLDFFSKESDAIPLMVWPQDIDPFLELNNGRYVTLLDLGRYGFGTRVDINTFLKKNQWSLTITGTYNESLSSRPKLLVMTRTGFISFRRLSVMKKPIWLQ
jgi:hypothetical protein